jgi:type I restriction enzyme, S subunit
MSELPVGWELAEIRDIAEYVQRGKSPKYTEKSELPVVNQKCVRWSGIDQAYLKFIHPDQWNTWSSERFLQEGDLLWNSTGTGTIGRAALFRKIKGFERAVVDSHVTIVRCRKSCLPHYLHYFVRSPLIQERIEEMHTGSTNQVELSRGEVLQTSIPLPPLPEQHRIVAKLDSLFTRSRRAREELEQVPGLCDRYKQVVLAAACSGRLTADWRERNPDVETASELLKQIQNTRLTMGWTVQKTIDSSKIENIQKEILHELPSSWSWSNLSEFKGEEQLVLTGPFGTSLGKEDFLTNGVAVITIGCLTDTGLSKDKAVFISEEKAKGLDRYRVREGDLLFSRMASVGKAAKVNKEFDGTIFNYHLMRLRLPDFISIDYFLHVVKGAPSTPLFLKEVNHGATRDGINTKELLSLPIPLPPLAEQQEIVQRVEKLFKAIDSVAQDYQKALQLLDRLDQATLAKAFRGELVPQDPNDEPAAALLERIHAEKQAEPKGKAVKSTRKFKATS